MYVVSLADPFPTLRGVVRVWSLLIDRFVSFPTIHGELYLECIAYESVRFPGYAELIRAFVTRPVLPVAMDLKSVIYTLLQQSMVISFAVNRRKVSWHLQEAWMCLFLCLHDMASHFAILCYLLFMTKSEKLTERV